MPTRECAVLSPKGCLRSTRAVQSPSWHPAPTTSSAQALLQVSMTCLLRRCLKVAIATQRHNFCTACAERQVHDAVCLTTTSCMYSGGAVQLHTHLLPCRDCHWGSDCPCNSGRLVRFVAPSAPQGESVLVTGFWPCPLWVTRSLEPARSPPLKAGKESVVIMHPT